MAHYMYEDDDAWDWVIADDESKALELIFQRDLEGPDREMMRVSPVELYEFKFGVTHRIDFEVVPPKTTPTLEVGNIIRS